MGTGLPSVYEVILDEELVAAGAPPRPSVGYLVQGMLEHGNEDMQRRFLPGLVSGRDRWCQGFSEPDAGSDLASLRTRAVRDGDEYVITGHKVWTSYSDAADWCLVLARTDPDVPKHRGISAFAVPMHQPGIEQRPLRMINGITREFGEVHLRRRPGGRGQHDRRARRGLAAGHDRGQPRARARRARVRGPLRQAGQRARAAVVAGRPDAFGAEQRRDLAWAMVEAEMLRCHVSRRLSDRLDGITHGPEGSVDKLLMTCGRAGRGPRRALRSAASAPAAQDDTWLKVYLYSRAQSVMGGTSQIQRNLVASRILGLPDRHERLRPPRRVAGPRDGPVRIVTLNRPEQLNATNHALHAGLAALFPQLDADDERGSRCSPVPGVPSPPAATSTISTSCRTTPSCAARP